MVSDISKAVTAVESGPLRATVEVCVATMSIFVTIFQPFLAEFRHAGIFFVTCVNDKQWVY